MGGTQRVIDDPSPEISATAEAGPIARPAGAGHDTVSSLIGHNSGASPASRTARKEPTAFQQIEAVLDCEHYSAQQKCIILKLRCRVDGKTLTGAIVSNAGLMRAASIVDWRTLRAELRELEGKPREIPKSNDAIEPGRALIARQERPGKATTFALSPERLQEIVSTYLEYRERKRGIAPSTSDAGGASDAPPASHAPVPLHPVQGDVCCSSFQ